MFSVIIIKSGLIFSQPSRTHVRDSIVYFKFEVKKKGELALQANSYEKWNYENSLSSYVKSSKLEVIF